MSRRKQSRPNRVQDEDIKCNKEAVQDSSATSQLTSNITSSICSNREFDDDGDDGSSGNEETPKSPNYQNTHFTCAFCEEIFENRFNLGLHFKMCPNKPIIETSDGDDDCNNFTSSEISDNKELVNVMSKKTHDEGADKNNNNDEIEESFADQEMDEDEDEESEDIPLDLSSTMAPLPPPSHVTLEALQNTKVAVAQFAATALANNYDNEDAIKELAALQSTLFNIQHQQLFQIQLIHQLQSQLSVNHECDEKKEEIEEVEAEEELSEDKKEEKEDLEVLPKSPEAPHPEVTVPLLENKMELTEPQEILKTEEKIDEPKTNSGNKLPEDTLEKPASEEKLKSVKDPKDIPLQTPYCQISSSLASSIITHHDPSPPPNGPNSLEMLQKRAQEVLDSASQGILAGNMADELAFRRDRASQDGKGRGEPFFKHRCRYCGKVFGSDSALQIHIRSHTGERPFQCNVCGSRFTTKGNLKVHYQRHTQRFPNIPMGQAPLPEHYDNYHAPLLPHHPSIRPPPNYPSNGNGLPFSHILPGPHLPMMRPPEDFVRSPPDIHLEKVQNDRQEFHESQEEPADLRVTTFRIASPPPKTPIESENIVENRNIDQKNKETCERSKQVQYISPANVNHTNSYEDQSIDSSRESDQEQPENLSKQSVRSSISRNSSISESAKEMETFANHPHYENHDNSWENLIEITKTSETSKLQQLVDNIENKLSDPNQCIFCQRILSCRSALQMHYRTHTGERPFRCRICSRAFATKGNLKAHMSIHKIKPPIRSQFRCPVCHNKYSNAIVLQEHIRTHSGEDMNMTSEQINAMEVRDEMSSPTRSGSTNNNLDLSLSGFSGIASESSQCDYDEFLDGNDDENDSDDDMFSEHTTTVLSEPKESTENINCNKSDKKEARNISKKSESHQMFGTNFEQSKSVKSLSESSESSCSALDLTPKSNPNSEHKIVEKKGSNVNSSYQHLPPTSVNLPGTMVPTSLIALAQSVPTSTPLTSIGGPRNTATCNICYKTFACNSALEIHFRSHTKERPYRCNFCDRAFSTKIEEIMHSTAHNSSAKGNLKQHLLTHKSREVNRSVEDLSSNSNHTNLESSFRAHSPSPKKSDRLDPDQIMPKVVSASTHSVDQNKFAIKRPFSDVDQPFFRLHLPPHMPVTNSPSSAINQNVPLHCTTPTTNINYPIQHSPVRPESANSESPINTKHLCTVCRKNFSSSSALQIHMRTHTGDKPFRCSVCQKAFTTKGNLKVHMGTHMWTNGASRRGRRMSLELPLNRPLPLSPQDTEFLQRRPDIFYPYIPPFLNGIQQKFGDLSSIPPPPYTGLANGSMSPHSLSNKYAGMLGFGPFLPGHSPNMPNFSLHGSPASPNSFNRKMQLGPPLNQNFEKFGEQKLEYSTQQSERMEKVWDLQYEGKLLKNLSEPHKSDEDREIPLQSNRKEELAT